MALRFPNPFSVYLHDTPSLALFEKSPRPFSSGCVRVEAVGRSLELLLSEAERKQVDGLLASGNTVEYKLPRKVPIVMAYWTAEADEQHQPLFRPDIYGHDAKLIAALNAATR
jgi:murein L,D-transpeptidase YcbB/YkuD